MTFGVCHHNTLIVKILFKTLIFPIIDKKNNQSLVSNADREIPTLGSEDNAGNAESVDNAGNLVKLMSCIICLPSVLPRSSIIDSICPHCLVQEIYHSSKAMKWLYYANGIRMWSWNYYIVNYRYLEVEGCLKLLISQNKFSGPRKFTLRY